MYRKLHLFEMGYSCELMIQQFLNWDCCGPQKRSPCTLIIKRSFIKRIIFFLHSMLPHVNCSGGFCKSLEDTW